MYVPEIDKRVIKTITVTHRHYYSFVQNTHVRNRTPKEPNNFGAPRQRHTLLVYLPTQQNETALTADRIAREGVRTRPVGPELFLPLSLRNWIGKRKQMKWRICERYGTSQLYLERSTNRYVQFISKLDRKHCRMLVGLRTRHINLQYMYAAHDEESKNSFLQEMRCKKGNVGTHSIWIINIEKDKDGELCLEGPTDR